MPPAGYPAFLQYLQSGRVRLVYLSQLVAKGIFHVTCVMFPVRKAPPAAARTKPALWRVSCPQALSNSATPIREMVLRREADCHSLHGKLAFLVA